MSLGEAALLEDVRHRLFAPSADTRTIGAEVELIPRFIAGGAPVLATGGSAPNFTDVVRRAASSLHWTESESGGGPPTWEMAGAGRLSFEPGGQIEISSPPLHSCSVLIDSLQSIVDTLSAESRIDGIELLAVGVDPFNDITAVPLQLTSERYARMTRYLESQSEFGTRMMRQTAAIQINLEHGPRPLERWTLLNGLAPYLIAIFANSEMYAGSDSGHASYRAHLWRELDASRTGLPFDEADAAARYLQFALDAGSIKAENGRGEFRRFRSTMDDDEIGMSDWEFHLSTLFPEIRPKEYFEIRSPDAIAIADLAAPLAFVTGIVYDTEATRDALDLVGSPDERLLQPAGREGLRNASIRSRARDLVEVAIAGAARLPAEYLSPEHRRQSADWLRRRLA